MHPEAVRLIKSLGFSPVHNYILPGLTSSLLGESPDGGRIRLFQASRYQTTSITPHSHRFDLHTIVLEGSVTNTLWRNDKEGSEFALSAIMRKDEAKFGEYETELQSINKYSPLDSYYRQGSEYFMSHSDIHSITFEPNTTLLLFESKPVADISYVLEPVVKGKVIQTLEKKDWMYVD